MLRSPAITDTGTVTTWVMAMGIATGMVMDRDIMAMKKILQGICLLDSEDSFLGENHS